MNRRQGLALAVGVAVSLNLIGCARSADAPTPTSSSGITGTVPKDDIAAPPRALTAAFGIPWGEVQKAIDEAKNLNWQYVNAGGVVQAAACTGSGGPTIVFSNGLILQAAWTWPMIATELAKTNRVCLFDRPGTGLSPSRPSSAKPNGPVANAKELFALMDALGEPGPFVIAGWSYGGIVARTAAAIEPHKVAGLNLIDAVTPTQYRTYDTKGWIEGGQGLDMRSAEKALGTTGPNFGSKPLVVLQAGDLDGNPASAAVWTAEQRQAASISTNSVHGIVPQSAHTIPQTSPDSVEVALAAVSGSVTSGSPMATCPPSFPAHGIVCLER